MAPTNTFLPRIVSVFYAIFHEKHGHQIVYQVPEGLIAIGAPAQSSTAPAPRHSTPNTPASPVFSDNQSVRRAESSRSRSPAESPDPSFATSSSTRSSPQKHPTTSSLATSAALFDFPSISTYVLPPPELCGRLLTISVRSHAVLGFPVRVEGHGTYSRTFFQYNVCFVFDGARSAELAPYEAVVRKVGRVLASCEQESHFLSRTESARGMHAILEQLYEDLNNYAEASIHIDAFNSLELKVFPFFPNPKPVYDWSVPVPLVDFGKRTDASWDMTIQRVYPHIDGINHVAKIALLAECDVSLVREAVSHLLYYQTVLLIDIFQFSNVYALRRALTVLATSKWVIRECGAYVARPGQQPLEWPTLLELYTHFAGGTSIADWLDRARSLADKIDIRRFVSFGVIKGFLRRIHRYPYLLTHASPPTSDGSVPDATAKQRTTVMGSMSSPPIDTSTSPTIVTSTPPRRKGSTATDPGFAIGRYVERGRRPSAAADPPLPGRRASLLATARGLLTPVPGSPRSGGGRQPLVLDDPRIRAIGEERRRQNDARSASSPVSPEENVAPEPHLVEEDESIVPVDLMPLLDGEHHTDELCVRFGVGWATLERWFATFGKGRVRIVLR
ncbi:NPR2-domain-containing protein [Exidia glandulosa HHB12029]|uniref:NPR2-domain-containing protein n=1 Tax=Exidia glandulosa HHB12029 TaxID=1314781 RepID=A0A165K6S9_EXIGL|nr:NPR2-domain-containing protein [Exidia glandulosa HHB12029]